MKYQTILLAAGAGTRSNLKINKVFYKIDSQTIFEKSIKNFIDDEDCLKIIVTYKNDENQIMKNLVFSNKIVYVLGGNTRQESVKNALNYVDTDFVIIHDAARPNFSKQLLITLKDNLVNHNCIIPVISCVDTIKEVINNKVIRTLNRENTKLVQTPQAFKTTLIKKAHNFATRNDYSDDSMMFEQILHEDVYCVDGETNNFKYTNISDFKKEG